MYKEAEAVVRTNLETAQRLHGPEHPNTLGTGMNLGVVLLNLGKSAEAAAIFRRLLATQKLALGDTHRDTLSTKVNLAGALQAIGKTAEAEVLYRAVLDTLGPGAGDGIGEAASQYLMCEMNYASCLLGQAKYIEAEDVLIKNVARKQQLLGPDHPDTLMAVMNLVSRERRPSPDLPRALCPAREWHCLRIAWIKAPIGGGRRPHLADFS